MSEATSQAAAGAPEAKPAGASPLILWAVLLGLACGAFFGELCRPLQYVGEAYIKLLQMTVMPYIMVSLVLGIGSLTAGQARALARTAGVLLLVFWVIALAMVAVLPLSFPDWQSAAFFSASLLEPPPRQDLLDLYIPANPFRSLAENIVPAVVLFSILVGVALMGVKEKSGLMRGLSIASEALSRITGLIVKLTPLGLFAIVAAASGTLSAEEFGRLQVYLVAYVAAALVLCFWVLPGLVTMATPFTYREVVGGSRDALITAFVTNNVFVVLPVLTQRVRELFRQRDLRRDATDSYVDVIVPVTFNFPTVGEVLLLLFVMFAAWFVGSPVGAGQYPGLAVTAVLSFFGNATVAIPYLLDTLKLPRDLFQLFLVGGVVIGWFASLLAAMNLLVFSILSVAALTGVAKLRRPRLLAYLGVTALLVVVMVVGLRFYFNRFVENKYTLAEVVKQMHLVREPLPAKILSDAPAPVHTPGTPRLAEIRARGALRVGFLNDRLPYAFENARGELVGYDVEMAHDLARTLGVKLEFVPLEFGRLAEALDAGWCDIVMSGVVVTPQRAEQMSLASSYRDETLALVVPSYRRKEFRDRATLRELHGLKVAYLEDQYYGARFRESLPNLDWTGMSTPRQFFEGAMPATEVMLFSAEAGSAWTLLYPRFAVVVPQPGLIKVPLTYPVPRGEAAWLDYVNAWIELKRKDGTAERLHNYWIEGRGAEQKKPRWSVLRNVLDWGQ